MIVLLEPGTSVQPIVQSTGRRDMRIWAALLAGGLAALCMAIIIGLIAVYTGAFNVAATEEHQSITRWAFDTTFRKSVELRAGNVVAPVNITAAMLTAGASAYKSMCEHCHAGPGTERQAWASGMRPRPPRLTEAAAKWEFPQLYWIVKHGVKMTGMPAFGPSHDDQTLWDIAAFVRELPAMTPERYAEMGAPQRTPGSDSHGG